MCPCLPGDDVIYSKQEALLYSYKKKTWRTLVFILLIFIEFASPDIMQLQRFARKPKKDGGIKTKVDARFAAVLDDPRFNDDSCAYLNSLF